MCSYVLLSFFNLLLCAKDILDDKMFDHYEIDHENVNTIINSPSNVNFYRDTKINDKRKYTEECVEVNNQDLIIIEKVGRARQG